MIGFQWPLKKIVTSLITHPLLFVSFERSNAGTQPKRQTNQKFDLEHKWMELDKWMLSRASCRHVSTLVCSVHQKIPMPYYDYQVIQISSTLLQLEPQLGHVQAVAMYQLLSVPS